MTEQTVNTKLSDYYLTRSEITATTILDQLAVNGLVIIPKYAVEQESFSTLLDSLATCYLDSPLGDRARITGEQNVQSVSIGKHPIDFHFEWGNLPFRPELLTFCCVEPPVQGGETILCDSNQVLHSLSSRSMKVLENNSLKYTDTLPSWIIDYYANKENLQRYFHGDFLKYLKSMDNYHIDDSNKDFIKTEYVTSAINTSHFSSLPVIGGNVLSSIYSDKGGQDSYASRIQFADNSIIPQFVLDEIKAAMDKHKLEVSWQKGDVVFIDNTRFLHGRNKIEDAKRSILLASVYTRASA